MKKVNANDLSKIILQELQNYAEDITEFAENAVKETAKEEAKKLRQTSPKLSGDYKKAWSYKKDGRLKAATKHRVDMVVYSKKPEYRKTHLLENGHAKRGGGRVAGIPHIGKVREEAEKRLQERILEKI